MYVVYFMLRTLCIFVHCLYVYFYFFLFIFMYVCLFICTTLRMVNEDEYNIRLFQ